MPGKVIRCSFVDKKTCEAHPDDLILFPDDMEGKSYFYREVRAMDNAIGLPVRKKRSWNARSHFINADYGRIAKLYDEIFQMLGGFLAAGKNVWVPDHIGEALIAHRKSRAPTLYVTLQARINALSERYGTKRAANRRHDEET